MDRKQTQPTPAGRASQQQNQVGGEAMRRFVWSTTDASGRLVPYVVLECDEETAVEIESRDRYENKWMFIAEKLHEKDPERFPAWFDEFGRRSTFWYNNVLEDWEEAYERLVEEKMRALREYYDDEEALLEEARERAIEVLSSLPVIRIEKSKKEGADMKELTTETKQGGAAMRKDECKYEVEEREYCNQARLGNVYVEGFQHDDVFELNNVSQEIREIINTLPELEPVMELQEQCDCYDKYGGSMHSDGGNYHSRVRVYEITPCVYLAVYGDTREAFSMSDYKYMIVWVEDEPVGLVVAKTYDCCYLLKREELEDFVKGYEEDGYSIYYPRR